MRSIFFPFEQMLNFINYLRIGHPFRVITFIAIISVLFFLIFNYETALVLIALFIIYIISAKNKGKSQKHKNKRASGGIFFGFILIFLAIVYNFTTKFYNEDLDITSYWSWWPLRPKETINIYSAEPEGVYHKIMDSIIRFDPSHFKQGKPESAGGYENPNRVMLDPHGLSFVKDDIFREEDKLKDQINYVTPLYTEKLHIVYNKKSPAFTNLLAHDSTNYFSIGLNDDSLIQAIKNCRIAVGKIGSSTKIISNLVLSEISNKKPSIDVYYTENATLKDAFSKIKYKKNGFDIIFFIAGQPVQRIKDLLKNKDSFGLIGIEPSFVDAINKNHDTKYRYTDFSIKKDSTKPSNSELSYDPSYESLPTLGSNCYLIANKKVKPYLIKRFIDDLSEIKGPLKIDFLNFKDNYYNEYQNKKNKTLASLLLALTGGVALGIIILSFIFALVSSFWHDKISNKLASIIKKIPDDSIPEPSEFEKKKNEERNRFLESLSGLSNEEREEKLKLFDLYYEETPLIVPYIKFYQIELINEKITFGMSQLVVLKQNINDALSKGKINTDHFNDLLLRTDTIMDKLRKSLFLRLHELFNRHPNLGCINKRSEVIKMQLLKYVTSNYLNFDDYNKLVN